MFAKIKPHWPLSLLILAILFLFWPALLHPCHILYPTFSPFSDTMVIHWPKAHLMAQSWQGGEGLPHWTPLILSGMPLAANQLAMLSYPPAWLFLIFPLEPVFNLLFIFHLLLGGVGVYLFLRHGHGLSPTAALLGSLTFALNGKWLAHAAGGHVSMVGAIGWMPWALFGLMMLLQKEKWGWALLIAISLAMQIVTHTLLLIYTVYLMAAMVVWHIISIQTHNRFREIKRLLPPLLAVPILAGLLGAAQLLPLLELVEFSNRAFDLSQAAKYAVSPGQLLVGLLLPSAQAGHEWVIYLGLIPLLLAPLGLSRQNRWTWFYSLLFMFTILFALGPSAPIHSLFYHFAPGFRWVRTPARIFLVGALAVAVLVGFGIDHLRQARWSTTAIRWLTRLTVALAGLALLTGLGLALGFDQVNRAAFALAIFIPAGLGLILLRATRILSFHRASILLGVLLFLDLASFDRSMMRFVSLDEALAPGRSAAEYLAQKPGLFRVYSPSYSLPMQTAAAEGLYLADGVEPVHLAIYDQYMARAGGYRDASFSVTIPNFGDSPIESALRETEPNLKLLGLLNVTYLVSAFPMDWPGLSLETEIKGTFIYRNEHALPRAWVAHQTIPAESDWLTQLENLPDLSGVVILEDRISISNYCSEGIDKSPLWSGFGNPDRASLDPLRIRKGKQTGIEDREISPVNITYYSPDRLEFKTEITAPGWLVLSEIWYPGWQATVNGAPQPVEKVNGLLRGVYLSQPGSYQITMTYRPRSVLWGSWISGVAVGLTILIGLFYFATCTTYKYFFTGRVVLEGKNCCSSSIRLCSRSAPSNSVLPKGR